MSVERIVLDVTNACNLDCLHCVRDNSAQKRHMPLEYVEKILTQAGRYGAKLVSITGGEPCLHPQLDQIVDLIARHNCQWTIVTNSTFGDRLAKLVDDPARRDKLCAIFLSLDGATAETDDFIRGSGHFRQTMKVMARMTAMSLPAGFITAVNALNVSEMDGIVDLAAKLGAQFVDFSHLHPTPGIIRRKLLLPMDRWVEVDRKALRLDKVYRLAVHLCSGSRCSNAFYTCNAIQMNEMFFDFKGDMTACGVLPNYRGAGPECKTDVVGNIGENDLWDLHLRLIDMLAELARAKLQKIKNNDMTEADYYPCIFCLKHFGKLEWLRKLDPQNEWLADDEPAADMQDMEKTSHKKPESAIT